MIIVSASSLFDNTQHSRLLKNYKMKDRLDLDGVVLLGRSLAEYSQYFEFSKANFKGARILDAGAGVSSFCAELSKQGHDVIALDPIYRYQSEIIKKKCQADLKDVVRQLPDVAHKYNWIFYKNIDDLRRHREHAYTSFLEDYQKKSNKYIAGSLPATPFGSNQFTITLVSYFLFLYAEEFDYEFHRESLLELARITEQEIRIYPLTTLRAKKTSYIHRLMSDPACKGLNFDIKKIGFEFLKNANELLVISKRA